MDKKNFEVIKGGISATFTATERTFVSAYATDTRLMGVVATCMHWRLKNDTQVVNFYQFFYYDAEEYGLDTYKSFIGNSDDEELESIEHTLIGGLGATKVPLTEDEARFLICHFAKTNHRLNQPLPEGHPQYLFLLDERQFPAFSREMQRDMLTKLCTPIKSKYQLANYFLMRAFAHDWEMINLLSIDPLDVRGFLEIPPSTLFKNSIEDFNSDNQSTFLCESLIECNNEYKIIVSDLQINDDFQVTSCLKMTKLPISDYEASMILSKPEFITSYDVMELEPFLSDQLKGDFDYYFNSVVMDCLATDHPHGRMYLRFNRDNAHVDQKEYRLNDDVFGTYYLSDDSQLIVTAYTEESMTFLERELTATPLGLFLLFLSKYKLKQSVGYQFVQSQFCDFEDFMASLDIDFDEDGNEEY